MSKIQSVEPNIADLANGWLKTYKLDYKLEQESLNMEIDQALNDYYSKMLCCIRTEKSVQQRKLQRKKRADFGLF